jgi:hypothetical protein
MHRILSPQEAERTISDRNDLDSEQKFDASNFSSSRSLNIKVTLHHWLVVKVYELICKVTGSFTLDLIHKLLAIEQKFDASNFISAQLKIRDTMRIQSKNSMHRIFPLS